MTTREIGRRAAPITMAEHIAQLQEIVAAQASLPEFKVGQLVVRTLVSRPVHMRDNDPRAIAAVVELVPNMREFTGENTDTTGPALMLGILDAEGGYAETLSEAWQYEVLSPEKLIELSGGRAH